MQSPWPSYHRLPSGLGHAQLLCPCRLQPGTCVRPSPAPASCPSQASCEVSGSGMIRRARKKNESSAGVDGNTHLHKQHDPSTGSRCTLISSRARSAGAEKRTWCPLASRGLSMSLPAKDTPWMPTPTKKTSSFDGGNRARVASDMQEDAHRVLDRMPERNIRKCEADTRARDSRWLTAIHPLPVSPISCLAANQKSQSSHDLLLNKNYDCPILKKGT